MPKLTHTLTVGRFELPGEYEAVPIDDAGTLGMPSQEWERLELEAATAVFQQAESSNGDELRCARKAMGLRQPDLEHTRRNGAPVPLSPSNDTASAPARIVAA